MRLERIWREGRDFMKVDDDHVLARNVSLFQLGIAVIGCLMPVCGFFLAGYLQLQRLEWLQKHHSEIPGHPFAQERMAQVHERLVRLETKLDALTERIRAQGNGR